MCLSIKWKLTWSDKDASKVNCKLEETGYMNKLNSKGVLLCGTGMQIS